MPVESSSLLCCQREHERVPRDLILAFPTGRKRVTKALEQQIVQSEVNGAKFFGMRSRNTQADMMTLQHALQEELPKSSSVHGFHRAVEVGRFQCSTPMRHTILG